MSDTEEARVARLRTIYQQDQKEAETMNADYNEMILTRAIRAENERVKWQRKVWRTKVAGILAAVAGFLALALLASGCCQGHIRAEAVDEGMRKVIERHARYVVNDPSLDETKRDSYLLTGELILRVLNEAKIQPGEDEDAIQTEDARINYEMCNVPGPGECGCVPEQGECSAPCHGCCPSKGCRANVPDNPGVHW